MVTAPSLSCRGNSTGMRDSFRYFRAQRARAFVLGGCGRARPVPGQGGPVVMAVTGHAPPAAVSRVEGNEFGLIRAGRRGERAPGREHAGPAGGWRCRIGRRAPQLV